MFGRMFFEFYVASSSRRMRKMNKSQEAWKREAL